MSRRVGKVVCDDIWKQKKMFMDSQETNHRLVRNVLLDLVRIEGSNLCKDSTEIILSFKVFETYLMML